MCRSPRCDPVSINQVVAVINPPPIDQRERAEITARVQSAEALKRGADEAVEHARADHEQAKRDLRRAEDLVETGSSPDSPLAGKECRDNKQE